MKTKFAYLFLTLTGSLLFTTGQSQGYLNMALALGVDFTYHGALYGGSVSFVDFNNDGWDDLTFAEGGQNPKFYMNINGSFTDIGSFFSNTDLIKQLSWVDYDNDGDQDLFLTAYIGTLRMFENIGNFQFVEITNSAGFTAIQAQSYGQSWGDYNNDGFLDVYIANYNHDGITNWLYKNNGDGTFTDISIASGLDNGSEYSFGALWIDYNHDGWQDLFIANDRDISQNYLYENNGDGTFSDVSVATGVDLYIYSMSYTGDDYDNDGDLDLYVSNGTNGNLLHRQTANQTFEEIATDVGVVANEFCWAGIWLDYDNNGWQDLYISTTPHIFLLGSNNFYISQNNGTSFVESASSVIPESGVWSHSAAIGDVNNDGISDLAIVNDAPQASSLFVSTPGSNNYLKVNLEGVVANRDGVGSWITVWANGLQQTKYTYNGEGYLTQNSKSEIFGLGTANTVDSLKVEWLSGQIDLYYNLDANQTLYLVEGSTPEVINLGSPEICLGDSILLSTSGNYQNVVWSTGQAQDSIYVSVAGSYYFNATLGLLSLTSSEYVTTIIPAADVAIDISPETCMGLGNGSMEIYSSNNISVSSISLNNQLSDSILTQLTPGIYQIQITDENGCVADSTVEILGSDSLLNVESNVTDISCYGQDDGSVEFIIAGGTPPYNVEFGAINPNNLAPGEYVFNIYDNLGCSILDTLFISEPDPLLVFIDFTPANTESLGFASASVEGGTPPYSYNWSNGDITEQCTNLDAGLYTVSIEDSNGCIFEDGFEIIFTQIDNIDKTLIKVFPNPAQNFIVIQSPIIIEQVKLSSSLGNNIPLQLGTVNPLNQMLITIPTSVINGPYILTIEFESGRIENYHLGIIRE